MHSKRCIHLLLLMLLASAFTGMLQAQDQGREGVQDQGKAQKKTEIPDLKKDIKKLQDEARRNPSVADPEILVDIYKEYLRFWPRNKDGQEAVSQILKCGNGTIPYVEKMLDGRDYRVKPAVAHILAKLEYFEAYDKIKSLLDDPRLKASTRLILQALHRLDPLDTEMFCLELLGGKNSSFRQAAFSLLTTRLDPEMIKGEKVAILQDLMKSEIGDVRHKAFELAMKNPDDALDACALSLMGDPDPQLAEEVMEYLASRNSPDVIEKLEAMLTFDYERPFAFALITLVRMENKYDQAILDLEMMPQLEKFISSRDPLFCVSVAAALGNLGLRSSSEADLNLIRNQVVPAFMQVFLSNRYYKDFSSMLGISAETMTKITGFPFGRDLTAWRSWWDTEGREFSKNQFLISLDPADYPRVKIRYENPEGGLTSRFQLAGDQLLKDPAYERTAFTVFLSNADMTKVIEFFHSQSFFNRRSGSLAAGNTPEDCRVVEVCLDDCERFMVPTGEDNIEFAAIERRLHDTLKKNLWQLLYPGGDFYKWWENRYAWWNEHVEYKERTDRFLDELTVAFETLPDEVILVCMDWLKEQPSLSESLDESTLNHLLPELDTRYKVDVVVEGVADLIVTTKNPELVKPMARYLYGTYGEKAFPILGKAVLALDEVETSLEDERWFVRAVAADVAFEKGERLVPRLIDLLRDEWPEVRHAAIRSLVVIGNRACRVALTEVMDGDDSEMKMALLDALNTSSSPWALAFYEKALDAKDERFWAVAFKGLTQQKSPQAAIIIIEFVRRFELASTEARMGVEALRKLGGQGARTALLTVLEDCQDPDLAKRIALGLAELGETSVFPKLGECMFERDLRQRALDAMAFLLVADFEDDFFQYQGLWEKYPGESQAFFLMRALGLTGPAGPDQNSIEGIPVSVLVAALSDESWPVMMAALRLLEEGTGKTFGALAKTSDEVAINTVAGAWNAWFEGVGK